MGYSELHCQLCRVTFAIGRIRTASEPISAAWDRHGSGFVGSYAPVPDNENAEVDAVQTDCLIAVRPVGDPTSNVSQYVPPVRLHPKEERYYENICAHPKECQQTILARLVHLEDSNQLEHIAGPSCGNGNGYNGNNISVQEMRVCNSLQGLVLKQPEWKPEEDDEEFEESGRYFLSGLVDGLVSIDNLFEDAPYPVRHGCDMVMPVGSFSWILDEMERGSEFQGAIAVHAGCVEVFKRVSLYHSGYPTMDAFTDWWERHGDENWREYDWECQQDVKESSSQWWQHLRGSEYLAADPCFIPGFDEVFFTPAAGSSYSKHGSRCEEIFGRISTDVNYLILDQLSIDDISALQLASPFLFRHSQLYLKGRIGKEWPWLWESWTELPYSRWASVTAQDLKDAVGSPAKQVVVADNINWGLVVKKIRNMKKTNHLKGLQNRCRIWNVCEKILEWSTDKPQQGN